LPHLNLSKRPVQTISASSDSENTIKWPEIEKLGREGPEKSRRSKQVLQVLGSAIKQAIHIEIGRKTAQVNPVP
jgi:hypothetical protein